MFDIRYYYVHGAACDNLLLEHNKRTVKLSSLTNHWSDKHHISESMSRYGPADLGSAFNDFPVTAVIMWFDHRRGR